MPVKTGISISTEHDPKDPVVLRAGITILDLRGIAGHESGRDGEKITPRY